MLPSGVIVDRISSVGVATISASTSRMSSCTPISRGLLIIRANASPSVTSASRIVRSLPARSMDHVQSKNARSIWRSRSSEPLAICSRGPVPIRSLASVDEMPARYELLFRS